MTAKAGAAPARKGSRFECRVVQDQQRLGRLAFRLRQGQGCTFDVVSLEPCLDAGCSVYGKHVSHVLLIQCRNRSGGRVGVTAASAMAMVQVAAQAGATALVATPDGNGVAYRGPDDEHDGAAK